MLTIHEPSGNVLQKHEFLAFPAAGLEFSFFRSAKSFNTEYIWCPASEVVWLLSPSSFSSCLFFILFIFCLCVLPFKNPLTTILVKHWVSSKVNVYAQSAIFPWEVNLYLLNTR